MKNHFAACVILYNPSEDDFKNIDTYIDKVSKLYIYDNTETKSNESIFKNYQNVHYFWNAENKGLSICLNQACEKALNDNFNYLLTMDQDSSFLEENIDQFFSDILSFPDKEKVAVYGLEYDKDYKSLGKVIFNKKDHLITSASVINLKLFNEIGGFDVNLFIDGVDIDYCYAAMTKGFYNIQFKNNYFKHSLGEPVRKGSVTSFYLIKKNVRIHSPIRVYYIKRNMLYLEEKYGTIFPKFIKEQAHIYKRHLKRCIKYSDDIFKVLEYRKKAINDFKNKKMGKFQS
jgi:rhamnosyltransferase